MEKDWTTSLDEIHVVNRVTVANRTDVTNVGSVTTAPGDRLLIGYYTQDTTSGYKLSSDMSSGNAFPNTANNQLHLSAHVFLLGDSANNVQSIGINQGFGRASFLWLDRGDVNNCHFAGCSSADEAAFGGIRNNASITDMFTRAGTDSGIGTQTYDMQLRGGLNRNPVMVVKFDSTKSVPDAAFIATMLEWMWTEWALNNHPILYPPLREFL